MTHPTDRLPDGFVVRLHDDVVVGNHFSRNARILRCAPEVREALGGREVVVRDDLTAKIGARLLDLDLAAPVLGPGSPYTLGDLTVVVPVRDRAEGVDQLLTTLGGAVRCLVVDDASLSPGTLREVADRHGADLVRLEENVGPAAARNVGLRLVTTPLVAFVDSDVTVSGGDLGWLLGHLSDPGLAAVAPRVRAGEGSRWFQRYERSEGGLDLGPTPATVRTWSAVAYVPSACLVARVDDLGAGFDEDMRSGEDVDLVWRLLAAGRRVRYEPQVVVEHDHRGSALAWAERQFFYGTSAAPLAQRHGVQVAPAVLTTTQAALLVSLSVTTGRWRTIPLVLALLVGARAWCMSVGETAPVRTRAAVAVLSMTIRQGTGMVVHHAAPISVLAALASGRARRVVMVLGLAEAALAWSRSDRALDPIRFAAARRLATAAYGCGAWSGAIKGQVWRAVVPHVIRPKRGSS